MSKTKAKLWVLTYMYTPIPAKTKMDQHLRAAILAPSKAAAKKILEEWCDGIKIFDCIPIHKLDKDMPIAFV